MVDMVLVGNIATDEVKDIASRIAHIIIAPETVKGMINGALTVPLDMGYLAWGYLDTDSRFSHQTQRIRMVTAIRHDILNYQNIVNAAQKILELFNTYLSESQQDTAYRSVMSSVAGRMLATKLVTLIAAAALERVSFIVAADSKGVIGTVAMALLVGGMSERSIRTAQALEAEDPEVYMLLSPHDYDLLYFLIEPAVKPFVDAIHVRFTQGSPAFNRIIHEVGERLNARQ